MKTYPLPLPDPRKRKPKRTLGERVWRGVVILGGLFLLCHVVLMWILTH